MTSPNLIKLVSWDFYGTILASGHGGETSDVEELEQYKLRPGVLEALELIKSKKILQITSSDGNSENIKNILKNSFNINWDYYFDDMYPLTMIPKDYSNILYMYDLKPENLLVIGDRYDYDIKLAKEQGCSTLHVPEEKHKENPFPIKELEKLIS